MLGVEDRRREELVERKKSPSPVLTVYPVVRKFKMYM
jgi:hypothetical protein